MKWSAGPDLEERVLARDDKGPAPLIWYVRARWPVPVRLQLAALWVLRHVLRVRLR